MTRLLAIAIVCVVGCGDESARRGPIRIFAAASLTDVLPDVAEAAGADAVFDFGPSSRLATQIGEGAPVDAFFSADAHWMDHVSARIDPATRTDLLGNALVVVVPAAATGAAPSAPADLAALTRVGLAAETVPAGRYADAALAASGLRESMAPRVIRGDDVRLVLAWVATGEVDAGVVYRTDALAEPRVRIAFAFPASSHPPIVYPAAVVRGSGRTEDAATFLRFCRSERGRSVFQRAGFRVLPPAP